MGLLDMLRGKPSRRRFVAMVVNAIRAGGEEGELTVDEHEFSVSDPEGYHTLFLGNLYEDYCSAPRAMRSVAMEHAVRTWFARLEQIPRSFDEAVENLLPKVRERAFWHFTRLYLKLQGKEGHEVPHLPLAEHLAVGLVYDLPTAMRDVSGRDLAGWGVSLEDALPLAIGNLRTMSRQDFGQAAPGVLVSPWSDDYDSARLLLTERFRELRLKGDPVVAIPNRNRIFICGAEDPEGLATMAQLTYDTLQGPRPVSGLLVRLHDTTWRPFRVARDHPAFRTVEALRLWSAARDHDEQNKLLEQIHEQEQDDVFVAPYVVAERPETGEIRSYCTLTRGVPTLLPRTDLVALVDDPDGGSDPLVVPWPAFERVAGDLLQPTEHYPVRYRVESYLGDSQLEGLRAEEVSG